MPSSWGGISPAPKSKAHCLSQSAVEPGAESRLRPDSKPLSHHSLVHQCPACLLKHRGDAEKAASDQDAQHALQANGIQRSVDPVQPQIAARIGRELLVQRNARKALEQANFPCFQGLYRQLPGSRTQGSPLQLCWEPGSALWCVCEGGYGPLFSGWGLRKRLSKRRRLIYQLSSMNM